MWVRLAPFTSSAFPTPLSTDNMRRKNVREQLLDEGEDDARPPRPKKQAHYSMRPIFDKYKRCKNKDDGISTHPRQNQRHDQASPSPVPDSPMIEELKRRYAALRVTLHSNGVKDVAKTEEALAADADEKIGANLSRLNRISSKACQLSTACLDCEVDAQTTDKGGQERTRTVQIRKELSRYKDLEAGRCRQLARLWRHWEDTQADINELTNKLHDLLERDPSKVTSGMFSNCEWAEKDDLDIDRRSKQVVEDMKACEEEFHEKLKDEETDILKAMLSFSLG
ncbi:hypothetical protein F4859DRAFT_440586 [Xylaria cf. heliscus]|nr:hypothetical protein F4859DRAFT_440586 [Xylaria cf. heliscus]